MAVGIGRHPGTIPEWRRWRGNRDLPGHFKPTFSRTQRSPSSYAVSTTEQKATFGGSIRMAFSAATTFCGGLPSPRPIKKHRPDHRAEGYDRGLHPHGVQHGGNVAGNHVCKGVPSPRPIKKRRPGHRAGGYDRWLHPHGVQHGDNVAGNHVCKGVPSPRPIKKHRAGHRAEGVRRPRSGRVHCGGVWRRR